MYVGVFDRGRDNEASGRAERGQTVNACPEDGRENGLEAIGG